jgi:OTU domain-containing protein 3
LSVWLYLTLSQAFEHYSTVRKIGGPFTGLPDITLEGHPSKAEVDAELAKGPTIHDWQIEVIQSSLPTPVDEAVIRQAIKQHRGNIDRVVSEFLDSQYYSSAPGTPGSLSESGNSSIERDHDSEDEDAFGPNKRQNRQSKGMERVLHERQRKMAADKLHAIPSLEVTAPESISSRHTSPENPAIQKIRNSSDVISVATSEDDTNSEYAASTSSRAPSVALGTTTSRPRIILRTASQKAKLERKRQQTSSREATPQDKLPVGSLPKQESSKPAKISARDRKAMKKTAQKQQAKVRKQGKSQPDSKLATSSANIKRSSPPMDKVLSLGNLSMIQI